jgi:hypothetical protein
MGVQVVINFLGHRSFAFGTGISGENGRDRNRVTGTEGDRGRSI